MRARRPLPCRTGLAPAKRLIWRMVMSIAAGWSASCGRHALLDTALSRNSTRSGDSSSASWKSVIAAK